MNDETLRKMEETIAHQQRQIDDLSEMVARQWDEIELLKKLAFRLKDKIVTLEATHEDAPLSVSEQAARDKPPHY